MIRQTTEADVLGVMNLIVQAQTYFKHHHIDQWQDNYPLSSHILNDIQQKKSYVFDNGDIIATMYFACVDEPQYHAIDGQWLTQQPYVVIHRIVVDERYKGQNIATQMLNYVIDFCQKNEIQSIRIDTHDDNHVMQHFLMKSGFQKCGYITLPSHALRVAFEKEIPINTTTVDNTVL